MKDRTKLLVGTLLPIAATFLTARALAEEPATRTAAAQSASPTAADGLVTAKDTSVEAMSGAQGIGGIQGTGGIQGSGLR